MNNNDSSYYMGLALELAEKGRYGVSPNPMVGCVIVKDGVIVGEGFHDKAGNPHAEIYAMRAAGEKAEGATVYLTLEPCCHYGRTPPCTNALIAAKVKKVVIPGLDPNPLVAGKGVQALRAVGIEVEIGIEHQRAAQLNEIFFHYITHKRPYVILKWAMSMDGKTMTHEKDSRQISCPETQHHAHQLRRQVDAILVGANTAIRDNPELTARLDQTNSDKQPLRIILSSKNKIPLDLKLFSEELPGKTVLIITEATHNDWYQPLVAQGVEVLMLEKNNKGQVNLPKLLDVLGARGITSLLVEGGMTVQHDFMQEQLVNKFHVYIANKLIGTLEKKQTVSAASMDQLGTDFHITGYCEGQKNV